MGMENYSLSDIRAATRSDNDGFGDFGGGSGLVWILLFAALGGGFGGFGGYNRDQAATTQEVASGFNFAGVNNKLNEITSGIAGINQNLGNAICATTYELGSKIDNCCCTTKEAIGQVRYDMAVQHGDLKALIHSENEATRNMFQRDKIESLQAQIYQLQLAQATYGIPKTFPYGWGITPIDFCNRPNNQPTT